MINVVDTAIEGVKIIEPKIFGDKRGYFYESYSQKDFEEKVAKVNFVQDNQSFSHYGVLRGLHFQNPPYSQSKLVRVIQGKVIDVAVDIRKNSPTYGQHVEVELTGENYRQFFIPKGFAHGFVVLSDTALFQYKCDEFYHPESEGAIAWNDPDLKIEWFVRTKDIELSEKDKQHQFFKNFNSPFCF
jgi:dTDP-4-dehydrorhamnose 3,5-epimerase